MKMIRLYFGVLLMCIGRLAVWAGQALFQLGLVVRGRKDINGRQRVSQSRMGVLVPYTVETKDGRYITLYGTRK